MFLLCFSNFVSNETRWDLGWWFIILCFIYVIVNTIVIIYIALRLMWRFLMRIFIQCRRRRLRSEAIMIIEKLNAERLGQPPPKKEPKPEPEEP